MKYLIYHETVYPLYAGKHYSIGREESCDIQLPIKHIALTIDETTIKVAGERYGYGCHTVLLSDKVRITLLNIKAHHQYLLTNHTLYLSNKPGSDIRLENCPCEIMVHTHADHRSIYAAGAYFINGVIKSGRQTVKDYDEIVFAQGVILTFQKNTLLIQSLYPITTHLLPFADMDARDRSKTFRRSPRIIFRAPEEQIRLASPPTEDTNHRNTLWRSIITPLAMIIFTIVLSLVTKNGGMMLMMAGMSVITIGVSIQSYISDKRARKKEQHQKNQDYLDYLDTKFGELFHLSSEQAHALNYHYPEIDQLLKMAADTDRRLYEKTVDYGDFLSYRLGLGEVPASFKVEYTESELTRYNAEVREKVNTMVEHYRVIPDVPISHTLTSPVGYVGTRQVVIDQMQQLMMQLATFHSYHDVQFIPVFREEEYALWRWSRWLPHITIKALNVRGFVYDMRTRDQVLTAMYQLIKDRKLDSGKTPGTKTIYTPSYVFLITDLSLMLDHTIMEYINEDLSALGIHYVFAADVIEELFDNIKTVVDYSGAKKGTLIIQDGEYQNKAFVPSDPLPLEQKDMFARHLAGVTHVETLRNVLPTSITFLEMYGVDRVEELAILNRWQENEAYRSLAVPLGVRGKEDILYLNLHEKSHGPHGLIAGTTGSGKSELIQSYILSLAVNFHPYEVAFLLIDYKGGGMANLFADLPHVVGTITNLDGNQANRALISIKAELKKRQRLFLEYDINHIDQYTKLYKEGLAREPLPHLLIISDEFAELKANQPDFMDELVSTARIGRSLGVKLILATQKPSGVVNDQIWSNSKFKIALKVQDVADSREVIKTPDAAEITETGRAYLQVGNNELYELFQSAWSGAPYNPEGGDYIERDRTIYEITSTGQYNAINKDLSGLDAQKERQSLPTELEVIVAAARDAFDSLELPKVSSPWLPPLSETVYAEDFQSVDFTEHWGQSDTLQPVLVGYQDIPEKQEQSPLYFDMAKRGHILLVSSPGFGKSTFLQSFAIAVMRKQTPAQAQFYLYDFGASGLISLADFPHIADYFTIGETEKITKSLRFLSKEVARRKKALSQVRAANLTQYNQLSKEKFPTLFIVIDGFDTLLDADFTDDFYKVLDVIARDGVSLGIYLVVTLSRLSVMRLQLQSNFKTRISLFLYEKNELADIIGRGLLSLEEIKGRAVTTLEEQVAFQVTLAYKTSDYTAYIEAVKAEAQAMREAYDGPLPSGIPMLPEKVTQALLSETLADSQDFVLGLDREYVRPVRFRLDTPVLMASDNPVAVSHYYSLLDLHMSRAPKHYRMSIFDPNQRVPSQVFATAERYETVLDVRTLLKAIIADISHHPPEQVSGEDRHLLLIPDLSTTAQAVGMSETEIKTLLLEGAQRGIVVLLIGAYQDLLANSFDPFVKLSTHLIPQVFLGMPINEQNHTRYPMTNHEPALRTNQGYLLKPDSYTFVQLLEI